MEKEREGGTGKRGKEQVIQYYGVKMTAVSISEFLKIKGNIFSYNCVYRLKAAKVLLYYWLIRQIFKPWGLLNLLVCVWLKLS